MSLSEVQNFIIRFILTSPQITIKHSKYILHFITVCQPLNGGLCVSVSPQLEYKSIVPRARLFGSLNLFKHLAQFRLYN